MRAFQQFFVSVLVTGACVAQGCTGTPPVDDSRVDRRLAPQNGVIQGTVTYQGPEPCSQDGHIVGEMVLLVFTTSDPPPPSGLANTAVNFQIVQGDDLFYDEPRNPGSDLYCPRDNGYTASITASSPFTIAPLNPGQYIVQAFYDYYGDFRPTFKIRNLPLLGDIEGGAIDVEDAFAPDPATMGATQKYQNPNYKPIYTPIAVGIPDDPNPPPGVIPNYSFSGDNGFVADNVTVTVGLPDPLTRPYVYAQGLNSSGNVVDDSSHLPTGKTNASSETNPSYYPIITMPQDIQVDAVPPVSQANAISVQQASFAAVRLKWGVASSEVANAVNPNEPFHFQIPTTSSGAIDNTSGGIYVWSRGFAIPESSLLDAMWPLVVFAKLADAPGGNADRSTDPQDLNAQGSTTDPIVIIQGITLYQDALLNTAPAAGAIVPLSPQDTGALNDHVTVLVRPSVVCYNPATIQDGGVLVTPWSYGPDPTSTATPPPLKPLPLLTDAQADENHENAPGPPLVASVAYGCLPTGRYGINVVYPTGQAWTLPNEAGSCGTDEGSVSGLNGGSTNYGSLKCSTKQRPVLFSQGTRAVLEITPTTDPTHCVATNVAPSAPPELMANGQAPPPAGVPDQCLPCSQRLHPSAFPECASQ